VSGSGVRESGKKSEEKGSKKKGRRLALKREV